MRTTLLALALIALAADLRAQAPPPGDTVARI